MSKFSGLNTEMTMSEAVDYLDGVRESLDEIYLAEEAPSGQAGTVWRYFWGNPRKITPLTVYFREIIEEEIEASEALLKDKTKKIREQAKKKLHIELQKLNEKNEAKISEAEEALEYLDATFDENEDLKTKLEDERSISRKFRAHLNASKNSKMIEAQANDIKFLFEKLTRFENVQLDQLESVKLMKNVNSDE
ncbi:hypothetical protein ACRN9F_10385 [Shewanella oncorhynchi]|uniref:hypothetical protein n=1 Tax=Shewanella TaxID=22 RepID=UPI0021DB256A|nr:hypothetical protein [Shewanella sp. SM87]MCU8008560.1 hypothetical protein [Shewanella sp. SM87]